MNSLSLTATGRSIDLLQPEPDLICIEDIARALSMQVRFNGHCNRFYSVAEHSWLVSQVAEQLEPCDPVQALLHDAAEAYLGDVITPLKNGLTRYQELEEVWLAAIAKALDFDLPLLPSTREADRILLNVEGVALMNGWIRQSRVTGGDLQLAREWRGIPITGLAPEVAYQVFMQRYTSLKARLAATKS